MRAGSRRRLLPKVLSVVLALGVAPWASAESPEISEAKRQDILELIEMTGALKMGERISRMFVRRMTRTLQEADPDFPSAARDIVEEEVLRMVRENLRGFARMLVPIYDRHFSHREIRRLIAFYQTDLGHKVISVMPQIMQESAREGQRWGRQLAPVINERVKQRLREEGYLQGTS